MAAVGAKSPLAIAFANDRNRALKRKPILDIVSFWCCPQLPFVAALRIGSFG